MILEQFGAKKYIGLFIFVIASLFLAYFLLVKPSSVYAVTGPGELCDPGAGGLCDDTNISLDSWSLPSQGQSFDLGDSVTFTSSYDISLSGEAANKASNGLIRVVVRLRVYDGSNSSSTYDTVYLTANDHIDVTGSKDIPIGWPAPVSAHACVGFSFQWNAPGSSLWFPLEEDAFCEDISVSSGPGPSSSSTPEPSASAEPSEPPPSKLTALLYGRVLATAGWSQAGVSGDAPLNGVDLRARAALSGEVFGVTNSSRFKYDCTNNGTFEYQVDGYGGGNTRFNEINDVCNYPEPGNYTAKVVITYGSLKATDTLPITVTGVLPPTLNPFPPCSNHNNSDAIPDPNYKFSLTSGGGGNLFSFGIHWLPDFQFGPWFATDWLTQPNWQVPEFIWPQPPNPRAPLLWTGNYWWSAQASDGSTTTAWATPQPFSIDLIPPNWTGLPVQSNPLNGSSISLPGPNADGDGTIGDIDIVGVQNLGCGITSVTTTSLREQENVGGVWVDRRWWDGSSWKLSSANFSQNATVVSGDPAACGYGGCTFKVQGPTSGWTANRAYVLDIRMKDILGVEANGQVNQTTSSVWLSILPGAVANAWLQTDRWGDIYSGGLINLSSTPNGKYIALENSVILGNSDSSNFGLSPTAHPPGISDWAIKNYGNTVVPTAYSYFENKKTDNLTADTLAESDIRGANGKVVKFTHSAGPGSTITIGGLNLSGLGDDSLKAVVVVDGNLDINGNISLVTSANNGLIFIVNGNITVGSTVDRIDGVYLAYGQFTDSTSNTPLTVNGSVYNLSLANGYSFSRTNPDPSLPAEKFNFQPKYLYLFRELAGKISFTWQEVAP